MIEFSFNLRKKIVIIIEKIKRLLPTLLEQNQNKIFISILKYLDLLNLESPIQNIKKKKNVRNQHQNP